MFKLNQGSFSVLRESPTCSFTLPDIIIIIIMVIVIMITIIVVVNVTHTALTKFDQIHRPFYVHIQLQ